MHAVSHRIAAIAAELGRCPRPGSPQPRETREWPSPHPSSACRREPTPSAQADGGCGQVEIPERHASKRPRLAADVARGRGRSPLKREAVLQPTQGGRAPRESATGEGVLTGCPSRAGPGHQPGQCPSGEGLVTGCPSEETTRRKPGECSTGPRWISDRPSPSVPPPAGSREHLAGPLGRPLAHSVISYGHASSASCHPLPTPCGDGSARGTPAERRSGDGSAGGIQPQRWSGDGNARGTQAQGQGGHGNAHGTAPSLVARWLEATSCETFLEARGALDGEAHGERQGDAPGGKAGPRGVVEGEPVWRRAACLESIAWAVDDGVIAQLMAAAMLIGCRPWTLRGLRVLP
eukprot:jgi/Botrbrau1/9598/Bobra.106_2s0020.1